jgi:hypothetical protein
LPGGNDIMRTGGNNVNITGINELLKKFQDFSDEIKVEVQKELVATAITEIETPAKESLTDKGHVDTGRLRASIYVKYKGNEQKSYSDDEGNGYACKLNEPVKDMKVSCGTDVPYAMKIERLDSYLINNYEASKKTFVKNIDKLLDKLTRRYS